MEDSKRGVAAGRGGSGPRGPTCSSENPALSSFFESVETRTSVTTPPTATDRPNGLNAGCAPVAMANPRTMGSSATQARVEGSAARPKRTKATGTVTIGAPARIVWISDSGTRLSDSV